MGRPKRSSLSGWIYHVLKRANARMPIFTKDEDFITFETVFKEAVARTGSGLRKIMNCRGLSAGRLIKFCLPFILRRASAARHSHRLAVVSCGEAQNERHGFPSPFGRLRVHLRAGRKATLQHFGIYDPRI